MKCGHGFELYVFFFHRKQNSQCRQKEQCFLTVTPRGAFCPAKAHRVTNYSSALKQICVYREDLRPSDEIAVALVREFFAWRVVGYFLGFPSVFPSAAQNV